MPRIARCAAAIIVASIAIIAVACGGSGPAPFPPANTTPSAVDEQDVDQQTQPGAAPSAAAQQEPPPSTAAEPGTDTQQEQPPSAATSAGSSHSEPLTIYDVANWCDSEENQRLEERAQAGSLMWGEWLDYAKSSRDQAEEVNAQDWPDALADLWLVLKSVWEGTIEIVEDYDRDELVVFTITPEDSLMYNRLTRIWENAIDSLRSRLPADWEILRDAGCFD